MTPGLGVHKSLGELWHWQGGTDKGPARDKGTQDPPHDLVVGDRWQVVDGRGWWVEGGGSHAEHIGSVEV